LENNINRYNYNTNYNENQIDYRVDYFNIINFYKNITIDLLKNKIQGVALNWNNIVRRKNLKFLYVENFNIENLIKLLTYQIGNIVLSNNISNKLINMVIFNAWNEWNEQAVLEPTETTGYTNLKAIKYFKTRLSEPIFIVKPNILLIDLYIDVLNLLVNHYLNTIDLFGKQHFTKKQSTLTRL
jgi:hypothetical protein